MYSKLPVNRSLDKKRRLTKFKDGGGCHLEFHEYKK